MIRTAFALAATLLLSTGCAAPRDDEAAELKAIARRHDAELQAFEAECRRFDASVERGVVRDFDGLGRLVVNDVELIGWPGSAFLRAEFTWVNTAGRTRRPPLVRLSITDPASGTSWSETLELVTTFGLEYGRGSTFTSWIEVPTREAHTHAGWSWAIELVASASADAPETSSEPR